MHAEQINSDPTLPEKKPSGDQRNDTGIFRALLYRSALALASCTVLVTLCYHIIDRPVAFFVHGHGINQLPLLKLPTHLPMALNALAPVIAALVAVRLAWGPWSRLERTLFTASVSLMVAIAFEYYLKYLFGRYWPETWVNDNPSLIGTGAYGFHPFHFGEWYGSFPSGHTARTFAALSVIWLSYPGWRWPCLAACAAVVISLVGMNYHFVGDTMGGVCLGWLTGSYSAAIAGLYGGGQQIDRRVPR